jgi:hypothetical protein
MFLLRLLLDKRDQRKNLQNSIVDIFVQNGLLLHLTSQALRNQFLHNKSTIIYVYYDTISNIKFVKVFFMVSYKDYDCCLIKGIKGKIYKSPIYLLMDQS